MFGLDHPPRELVITSYSIHYTKLYDIVGVDTTLKRVGFGKGMYDRFYEKENRYIKKTVFVARELCYSKEIITDDYDVKADMIITA